MNCMGETKKTNQKTHNCDSSNVKFHSASTMVETIPTCHDIIIREVNTYYNCKERNLHSAKNKERKSQLYCNIYPLKDHTNPKTEKPYLIYRPMYYNRKWHYVQPIDTPQ